MKKIVTCALLTLAAAALFAGDAAVFSEMGFSEDGKTYIFGQYGKTDQSYEAWAEIYTVDVARNDFIKDEVYRLPPCEATACLSGKQAYEDLLEKSRWKTSRYNCTPTDVKNLLYVRDSAQKASTDEIVFKDFAAGGREGATYYHVRLVPSYEGQGAAVQSRFHIILQKQDEAGNLLYSRQVGTPDFKRKGVTNYSIERIFTDASGSSLVFVVEKTVEDVDGISIRYMVETMSF